MNPGFTVKCVLNNLYYYELGVNIMNSSYILIYLHSQYSQNHHIDNFVLMINNYTNFAHISEGIKTYWDPLYVHHRILGTYFILVRLRL